MTDGDKLARIFIELRVTTFTGAMAELSLLPGLKEDLLRVKRMVNTNDREVTRVVRQRAHMAELLDRMPHHGPNGSYSKWSGQCWPDCVACEWERFKTTNCL
jgi:hypothetical protein